MFALLEAQKAGLLKPPHLTANIQAGIVVGIISLPLCMAFAIASGAKAEQGLYTAIVGGLIAAIFGGSRVLITGPTGAFIVILAAITAKHGIVGLQIATLMAGAILLAMGLLRLGMVIKYIPDPVVTGFTAGIALIIFAGQWKDFFGLPIALHDLPYFHQKVYAQLLALPQLHPATTGLALAALAILIVAPRLTPRIPAPFIALVGVTLAQYLFQFEGVKTVGDIPETLPHFEKLGITFTAIVELIGSAITIAMLGAIESLLSAVVADGMSGTHHDSNQELIGQGLANMVTPFFGGFAATGAIARTATGIRNGATSPVSSITNAVVLVLILLFLAPLARHIPLAVLAAILFIVAWNMSEARRFIDMARYSARADKLVLILTFVLTVFTDLVLAVNVGVILAALLFMHRMAGVVKVEYLDDATLNREFRAQEKIDLPYGVIVYSIDGPFFFGAAEKFERNLQGLHEEVRVLILRMGRVPFIDATGLQALSQLAARLHKNGKRLALTEMNERVQLKLERIKLAEKYGVSLYATLADAVATASATSLVAATPTSTA